MLVDGYHEFGMSESGQIFFPRENVSFSSNMVNFDEFYIMFIDGYHESGVYDDHGAPKKPIQGWRPTLREP